jgi:aspartate carbamoyltransferase regulatory subunit
MNNSWVSKTQDEILSNIMQIDKKHVSNLIKDLQVDNKLQVKLESTKDEIVNDECKEHQKPKIKSRLYNASKMIMKNKKSIEKLLDE